MFGFWETLYVGLALFGSLFLIIQLLLGNLGDADFDAPELEADFDLDLDVDADAELVLQGSDALITADGHSGAPGISFLTPLIIAPALAGVGLVGLALSLGLHLPLLLHLPLALVGGLGTGTLLYLLLARVLAPMQGSSEVRINDLWGTVATVITPIPAGRVGEIQFVARGAYHSVPARAVTGESIARGQLVIVDRIEDSVAYVRVTH